MDSTLQERTFGVSFSIGEKLSISNQLDAMGVSYIASPFSAGNPNDVEYLKQVRSVLKGTSQPVIFIPETPPLGHSLQEAGGEWIKFVSFSVNCWKSNLWNVDSQRKIRARC